MYSNKPSLFSATGRYIFLMRLVFKISAIYSHLTDKKGQIGLKIIFCYVSFAALIVFEHKATCKLRQQLQTLIGVPTMLGVVASVSGSGVQTDATTHNNSGTCSAS